MRFSILIPVYNMKEYLSDCMNSVLTQNFRDYEVVLVDDGSTDNSGTLCDSYTQDPRVRVIHKDNEGLLQARRTGIAQAKGEFCIFLDSDDAMAAGTLERIDNRLRETEADILIFNMALIYNDDFSAPKLCNPVFSEDRVFTGEQEKREIYEKLLYGFALNNLVLKVIRTPLVQGDDTDYAAMKNTSMGEDLMQSFYPITKAKSIAYTGACCYYYRQNNTSMTHFVDPARLEERFATYNPNLSTMRLYYAKLWGLGDDAHIHQVYRASLLGVRNFFNSVFVRCKDATAQKKWCAMPWETLLPRKVMDARKSRKMKLKLHERVQLDAIFAHRYTVLRVLAALQKLRK